MIDVTTSEPLVTRSPHGSVMVRVSEDEAIRFRTVAAYNAWLEELDREQVAHEEAAIDAFEKERDSYQAKVRDLRSDLRSLIDERRSAG